MLMQVLIRPNLLQARHLLRETPIPPDGKSSLPDAKPGRRKDARMAREQSRREIQADQGVLRVQARASQPRN